MNWDINDIQIHSDSLRFIKNMALGEGRGITGLNHTSTVANLGRLVSIRSSTLKNHSAAVMKRSGAVDMYCADTLGAS